MFEGAAEFLFADGEGGGPLVGPEGHADGGFAHEFERFTDTGAGRGTGVFLFGEFGKTAVEDREGDLARKVFQPVGGGVGSALAEVNERIEILCWASRIRSGNRRGCRRIL